MQRSRHAGMADAKDWEARLCAASAAGGRRYALNTYKAGGSQNAANRRVQIGTDGSGRGNGRRVRKEKKPRPSRDGACVSHGAGSAVRCESSKRRFVRGRLGPRRRQIAPCRRGIRPTKRRPPHPGARSSGGRAEQLVAADRAVVVPVELVEPIAAPVEFLPRDGPVAIHVKPLHSTVHASFPSGAIPAEAGPILPGGRPEVRPVTRAEARGESSAESWIEVYVASRSRVARAPISGPRPTFHRTPRCVTVTEASGAWSARWCHAVITPS